MARPTPNNPNGEQKKSKLNDKTLVLLRQAFSIDATVDEACFYAGIDQSTFYRWKKEYPELCKELERLRNKPVLKARQTIVSALNKPDYALKYLERKKKGEFSVRQELEHSGDITVSIVNYSDLDEEK